MSNRSHHISLIRLGILPVMMRLEILSVHITFHSNSDFIILHLILMPLSLSPSSRRPVPLQEGPLGPAHWQTVARPRAQAPAVSDNEEGADIISPDAPATSPVLEMASLGAAGRSGGA